MSRSQKRKKYSQVVIFYGLLGSVRVKVVSKMLVKSIPAVSFTNILQYAVAPISIYQKITNPNSKHLKDAQKTSVEKSCM